MMRALFELIQLAAVMAGAVGFALVLAAVLA